jgi:flagellar biosynthetic protein FliQ
MQIGDVTNIVNRGIFEVILISAPFLIAALVVGLVIAILQATTSIQEQTMTFAPKLIAILLVIGLLGGWMLSQLGGFTTNLFNLIPDMAR